MSKILGDFIFKWLVYLTLEEEIGQNLNFKSLKGKKRIMISLGEAAVEVSSCNLGYGLIPLFRAKVKR